MYLHGIDDVEMTMTFLRPALASLSAVALVSAAACSSDSSGGDTTTLQVGHIFPTSSPVHEAAQEWADQVVEETDGRVEVKIFPASQLGSDVEMGEGLKSGSTDCALVNHAAAGMDPKLQLSFLPYIVTDYEGADQLFYGDGFVAEHDRKLLKGLGVEALAFYENDFRGLSNSTRPVTKPSDLKGLKLRVPETPIYMDMFKAWDAAPLAMAFSELYTALQQGTVDGQDNGLMLSTDTKFGEVQDYMTFTNHAYGTGALACNETVWSTLSTEDQEVTQEAAATMSEDMRKSLRDARQERMQQLDDEGVEVTELTDAQMAEFVKIKDTVWPEVESTFGKDVMEGLAEASDEVTK